MTKAELEARRDELAEEWNDNNIFEDGQTLASWTKDAYKAGFDSCAALLQREMDAEKERYELALASSIRYGNKVFDLESQLHSANAKLAVMKAAIAFYADDESGTDDCSIAREALAAINDKEDMA